MKAVARVADPSTEAIGAQGEPILTLPRGFYLKKNFTRALLERHFLLQQR